jgi:hypothetical protein
VVRCRLERTGKETHLHELTSLLSDAPTAHGLDLRVQMRIFVACRDFNVLSLSLCVLLVLGFVSER